MKNDFFQTFNLRKSNPSFGRELTYLNDHLRSEYADPGDPYDKSLVTEFSGFMAVTSFEYLDMTVSEYLNNKNKYEELIGRIYTGVPSSEKANIERLKQEINASLKYYEAEINTEIGEIEIRKSEGSEQKISGDVRDNFSLVNSAAQYFRSGYKYSLVTDNISGENTMLGNFLYETKSGHCALYATALTLYLRSEGIPARYVTGYAVDGSGTVTSDGYYQHIVTERDLHAWVEVYFKNLGWVPFDPTPPITEDVFLEAERASLSSSAAAEPFETSEPELPDSEQPDEMDTDERSAEIVDENTAFDLKTMFVFVLIVFCLLLVVVLALYIISLYKKENRLLKNFKNIKNLSSAKKASAFISSLWRAEGLIPFSSELPLDFADRVDGKIELFYTAGAKRTAEIMEKLEFSKEEPNTEEYAVLSAYVIALYKHSVLSQKTFKRLIKMMAVLTNV
ncbi:MAG: transglutaminase-like domain-containing protein [Eubacterium sp.]|jgi:hypothetical protein|nr:transglutaminase-like domain-containing protein [Eubacterium sp.]